MTGGAGAIQAMIDSLKQNKKLLKKRKAFSSQKDHLRNATHEDRLINPQTRKNIGRYRQEAKEKAELANKRSVLVLIGLLLVILVLLIMIF